MLLRKLGEQKGMLGQNFTKLQNKITDAPWDGGAPVAITSANQRKPV